MNQKLLIQNVLTFCAALLGPGLALGQNVNSNSDYTSALSSINSAVTDGVGNSYSLEFNSGLSVTPNTGAFINAGTGNAVSINGNGGTLSGSNTLTPVVIFSGEVNLSNMTIQNGLGKGGDTTTTYASSEYGNVPVSPGGGAGLGGGLFIATSSVVTLHNVSFSQNSTAGGRTLTSGGSITHGGNASFVLGLGNVDSNGVPTAGAGNHIAGGLRSDTHVTTIFPHLMGPGTSAGGQQSLSYIPGTGGDSEFASPIGGNTGSTYDGAGGSGLVQFGVGYPWPVTPGDGKMGGGDGSAGYLSSDQAASSGGGGLVGGAGMTTAAGFNASGGGFGGGGGGGGSHNNDGSPTIVISGGGGGFGGGGGGGIISSGGAGFGGLGGISQNAQGGNGWGINITETGLAGASLGGGIFVMFGADLTITGSGTFSGNTGGEYWVDLYSRYGIDEYYNLGAVGSDLFVMSGAKTTLAPGFGETLRFQGTIDDDSGAFGYNGTILHGVMQGSPESNGPGALIKIGNSSNPGGTVIFEGRTGYAGGTEMNSGTLIVDGNTGSIMSGSDLSFTGKSEFRYDNTNSGSGDNKTQIFNTLAFNGGDGTVSNVKGNANSSTLEFYTVTRAMGATGNFVAGDGTNGGNNKILVGGSAGVRSPGLFFGGNNYAVVDDTGYVRGINYGVDANSILAGGGSILEGTPNSSSNVKLAGTVTEQTTVAIRTLNLADSYSLNLADGQTLTVSGILQSGLYSSISGGNGIVHGGAGGETDLVIRTDGDGGLEITNTISAPNLTKSGEGTLYLHGNNSISGKTTINDGTVFAESSTAFGTGSVAVKTGGFLILDAGVVIDNSVILEGGTYQKINNTGDSYAMKASSSFEGGNADTTAEVLEGTASVFAFQEMSFSELSGAGNDLSRTSDVLKLTGTGSDVFVLQLSISGVTTNSILAWNSAGTWVNAVEGNTGPTGDLAGIYALGWMDFVSANGGFDASTMLGAYGYDVEDGTVWAVLNHNSEFAVLSVPEPGTAAMLLLGGLALLARRRR